MVFQIADAPAQTVPIDAVQVLLIDHRLKTLTGSLIGLHTREGAGESYGRSPDSGSCPLPVPGCRAGSRTLPRLIAVISYGGKPKKIAESVKTLSPKIVLSILGSGPAPILI